MSPDRDPQEPVLDSGATIGLAALAVGTVVLAGCGQGGGGGSDQGGTPPVAPPPVGPPPVNPATQPLLTVTAVTVSATASEPATIRVAGTTANAAGEVRFALDGTSRPADPGHRQAERAYPFQVSTSASSGGASATTTITLNPAPERVLTVSDDRVARARHLSSRIAFGPTEDELNRWRNLPYATVVDHIVDSADPSKDAQPLPAAATFTPLTWAQNSALSDTDKEAYSKRKGDLLKDIYVWWLREITISEQPIVERMALFWHNMLAVSAGDVFEPRAMWDYLTLLRRNALGSFRTMIMAIARDPAMCDFLDSTNNVKGRPNENFARELMELFTLGEGQVYTEQDVVEVAKCFTGWGEDDYQRFVFRQDRHEPGPKTVLGITINFSNSDPAQVRKDGEAVIDRILSLDRTAVFIAEQFWDELIGGTRDNAAIAGWATAFRGPTRDYDIRRLVKTALNHPAFTAPAARGTMIRSPIELHAAIFRASGVETTDYIGRYYQASSEDQALLNPPNVRGWVGGLTWISAKSLIQRRTHMGWTGWEFANSNKQRIPTRIQAALQTMWFVVPPVQTAYIAASSTVTWDPASERIRRLLFDPALNLK